VRALRGPAVNAVMAQCYRYFISIVPNTITVSFSDFGCLSLKLSPHGMPSNNIFGSHLQDWNGQTKPNIAQALQFDLPRKVPAMFLFSFSTR
jgi:hypothetical protein